MIDTHLTHRVKWPYLWYDYSMGLRKKFTPEELKPLRANPYTQRVAVDSIILYACLWPSGLSALQGYISTVTFRKLGYNTEIMGFEGIHSTTKRIRRAAKSPVGFHEGTRGSVRLTGSTGPTTAPADEASRWMKREILVL